MAQYMFMYGSSDPQTGTSAPNGAISDTTIKLSSNQYPYSFSGNATGGAHFPWYIHPHQGEQPFRVKVGAMNDSRTAWEVGPFNILEIRNRDGSVISAGYKEPAEHDWIWVNVNVSEAQLKSLAGRTLSFQVTIDDDSNFGPPFYINYLTKALTLYNIGVLETTNGQVSVDKTSAEPNETITIKVTPNSGYHISSVKAGSITTNYSRTENGIYYYTFTMPASDVSVSVTFERDHALSWSGSNSLIVSQNDYKLTATLTGSATDTWSHTITYKLYGYNSAGQTIFNETFGAASNNVRTVQIPITDANIGVQYTFKAYAVCNTNSAEGPSFTITPRNVHKTVQYRVNGQWVECIPYYRINDGWQEVEPYYQKDGVWIPCSKT